MSDAQLSFRKSANIDRVTDKRKDSLFRLVDTDGSGTIDAQEFAVLYDAIKKDLAEELEKEAALQKEASSARRRFKMLLLFVAVLVAFLAASVAANFAVIFAVVDQAITTTTTSSGVLEVKGTGAIAKTAIATEDVPLFAAPALDLDTLAQVKSLKVTYGPLAARVQAQLNIIAVRKHNSTFVEFVTDVPGETVETLNGRASLVRFQGLTSQKYALCSANATCSAFSASGIDADAAIDEATSALVALGVLDESESRKLAWWDGGCATYGTWLSKTCGAYGGSGPPTMGQLNCPGTIAAAKAIWHGGYWGTRHVVFLLHSLGANGPWLEGIWCAGTGLCEPLTIDEFMNLAFVIPTSGITGWGTTAWNSNPAVVSTYAEGMEALSDLVCGVGSSSAVAAFSGSCNTALGSGFIPGTSAATEFMLYGFSNGGGLASIATVLGGPQITAQVAVDYYAAGSTSTLTGWLIGNGALNLKIYTSCASSFYSTAGVVTSPTFAGYGGLSSIGSYGVYYPLGNPGAVLFTEYGFESATGYFYYAVEGLAGGALGGSCSENVICSGAYAIWTSNPNYQCTGASVHEWMMYYSDLVGDIGAWVEDPPSPPSPPGAGMMGGGITTRRLDETAPEGRELKKKKKKEYIVELVGEKVPPAEKEAKMMSMAGTPLITVERDISAAVSKDINNRAARNIAFKVMKGEQEMTAYWASVAEEKKMKAKKG